MRHVPRPSITRLAPVFWAGAAVLVGLICSDPDWKPEVVHGVFALMLLLTGAAIACSACQQIKRSFEKTHDDCVDTMLKALVRTRPSPAPALHRHRFPAA